MASGGQKRIIQLTGFEKREKKALLKWLFKLDCVFLDNKVWLRGGRGGYSGKKTCEP